jgi:hypothetical protein
MRLEAGREGKQAVNPQEAFLDLLIAAMKDAALERKLSQLQTQINADGKGLKVVRIVVIPEEMDHRWPSQAPLGTPKS